MGFASQSAVANSSNRPACTKNRIAAVFPQFSPAPSGHACLTLAASASCCGPGTVAELVADDAGVDAALMDDDAGALWDVNAAALLIRSRIVRMGVRTVAAIAAVGHG
jgi:hypothetical protein